MTFFLGFFGAHANLVTSPQGHQPAVESVGRDMAHAHAYAYAENHNRALTVGVSHVVTLLIER